MLIKTKLAVTTTREGARDAETLAIKFLTAEKASIYRLDVVFPVLERVGGSQPFKANRSGTSVNLDSSLSLTAGDQLLDPCGHASMANGFCHDVHS
jgi:hypothetical protein